MPRKPLFTNAGLAALDVAMHKAEINAFLRAGVKLDPATRFSSEQALVVLGCNPRIWPPGLSVSEWAEDLTQYVKLIRALSFPPSILRAQTASRIQNRS